MAIDESYRIERVLGIFTILMAIFILFGLLSFIGVIDTRQMAGRYCLIGNDLSCSGLDVDFTYVKFGITNNAKYSMVNIIINPESNKCDTVTVEELAPREYIEIEIPCSVTAAKGKKYIDRLDISYLGGGQISGKTSIVGKIKETV